MKIINLDAEMIVYTNSEGKMKPIRYRVSEGDELKVIEVKSIDRTEKIRIGNNEGIKYYCKIIVDDIKKSCELIYNLKSMKWTVYKM